MLVALSGCFVEPQLATQAAGREPGQSWHPERDGNSRSAVRRGEVR